MRIAHLIDPLIGVIPDVYLPESRDAQWQQDRLTAFGQGCASAVKHGAEAILVTGRLFAQRCVTDAMISQTLDIIRRQPCPLVWLPDKAGTQYLRRRDDIPENLVLLGGDEAGFSLKDAHIIAWSDAPKASESCNILVFDGTLPAESTLRAARTLFPSLRYAVSADRAFVFEREGFRAERLAKLENTGFDDRGKSGWYLLKLEDGRLVARGKVEARVYGFRTVFVDVEADDEPDGILKKCESAVSELTQHDLVRIILNGSADAEAFIRAEQLRDKLKDRFFYTEVFNNCTLVSDENAHTGDISLESEFIRGVLADDTLSETEKSRVIQCGRSALRGKELSE